MKSSDRLATESRFAGIADYILSITHEIWEERHVHQILKYYTAESKIYTLRGIVHGAEEVERNTVEMLAAFPDRLLIGENVIWNPESHGAFYTSHRITSPMTNLGDSEFGPATGKRAVITTIADCIVKDDQIHEEWLVRDTLGLVVQLGFDPHAIARRMAAAAPQEDFEAWRTDEIQRVKATVEQAGGRSIAAAELDPGSFAAAVLHRCWSAEDRDQFESAYAPYAVLHDSTQIVSGRKAIWQHYAALRASFPDALISVDHVCLQPAGGGFLDLAVRWTLAGPHAGPFAGVSASGTEVLILGITHWRLADGRIAAEWTLFDQLAVLAQMYRHGSFG